MSFDRILPSGTAIGCASNVQILGFGFTFLGDASPPFRCYFGDFGSTSARVVNDTVIECSTPLIQGAQYITVNVSVGSLQNLTVSTSFRVYDPSDVIITSIAPQAGSYNLVSVVKLAGSFLDLGA
eukprot:3149946-Pleurochrysis_carterae.AAC.1